MPHFPGAPRSERPLLPRRAGALWEGPATFGRNRESRTREAAGRRNWPEAVPGKIRGRKRLLTRLSVNRVEEQHANGQRGKTREKPEFFRLNHLRVGLPQDHGPSNRPAEKGKCRNWKWSAQPGERDVSQIEERVSWLEHGESGVFCSALRYASIWHAEIGAFPKAGLLSLSQLTIHDQSSLKV